MDSKDEEIYERLRNLAKAQREMAEQLRKNAQKSVERARKICDTIEWRMWLNKGNKRISSVEMPCHMLKTEWLLN